MPVAKLLTSGMPDAMNQEEGTDSLDTFIRQAVGKEPLFSFSRTGDNPTQWIQLLHNFDQQDLSGWPLLAPIKVQMQKCDKCAREFCSTINFRRHIRKHRRSMKLHKEPQKYRDLLGAFWDKLSYDESKEVTSFEDVSLEEVPGSSIVNTTAVNLRKASFLSLPQVYVKAGSALVDIVEGRRSRLPISSEELFSVLDDASERTFLCAGTAESLKRYVFDGEADKIGLETKNLIACISFLLEQKLVKAWVADKDAEALRCQKLLVEEEEAAQRRQAKIIERKRQRKMRQKEQRVRDQCNVLKVDLYTTPTPEDDHLSATIIPSEEAVNLISDDTPIHLSGNEHLMDIHHFDNSPHEKHKMLLTASHHSVARWQLPKSQRGKGLRNNQNGNFIKREQPHKHRKQTVNSGKIWTKKPKSENDVKSRVRNDAINQTTASNYQLMIGSISVTVRSSTCQHQVNSRDEFQDNDNTEIKMKSVQTDTNLSHVKFLWPPHDTRSTSSQILDDDDDATPRTGSNSNQQSFDLYKNDSEGTNSSNVQLQDSAKPEPNLFSIDAAKAFLSRRWKEAICGEHVELVVASEGEEEIVCDASPRGRESVKPALRTKADKSINTDYIPKQRALVN